MAVDGISGDRNYTSWINGGTNTDKTNTYNAVINTDGETGVSMDDFFHLMITQMTNQDFMNPSGDTEYMSQMAQFYSMQSMQEVAKFSKQNNAMSLVGQYVSATKYNVGGTVNTQTGKVDKIVQKDGEYQFFVNNTAFTAAQITEVFSSEQAAADSQKPTEGDGTDKPETPPADTPQTPEA